MYISNITHFIDEEGNIPKMMPVEAREMTGFLAMVIDETTKGNGDENNLRCFKKKCLGTIKSGFTSDKNEIFWKCSSCDNEGVISEWQGTKWNNLK